MRICIVHFSAYFWLTKTLHPSDLKRVKSASCIVRGLRRASVTFDRHTKKKQNKSPASQNVDIVAANMTHRSDGCLRQHLVKGPKISKYHLHPLSNIEPLIIEFEHLVLRLMFPDDG